MLVYVILIITLLMGAGCLRLLWRATAKRSWHLLPVSVSMGAVLYLYGPWVFLSVYVKYVFALGMLVALLVGMAGSGSNAAQPAQRWKVAANLSLTVVFSLLTLLYYTGTTGKPYGVAELSLPFKSGDYFVFQGGKGLPSNLFHYELRGVVYAMDIVKLNKAGNRAKRIFSERLEDYEIYGDTLYSPCDGVVLRAKDDNPDNIPPAHKRGPSNTNQVLIAAKSFYVFMGHLKPNCVFVHEGDTVRAGQPLGCAGNSGFTLEPHLHIQVHARTDESLPWYKEPPMLIAFGGKSYLLFEVMRAE